MGSYLACLSVQSAGQFAGQDPVYLKSYRFSLIRRVEIDHRCDPVEKNPFVEFVTDVQDIFFEPHLPLASPAQLKLLPVDVKGARDESRIGVEHTLELFRRTTIE